MPLCRQLYAAGVTAARIVVAAKKVPATRPVYGRFQIGSFSVTRCDNRLTADAEMVIGPHTRNLPVRGSYSGVRDEGLGQIPSRLLPNNRLAWADTPDAERSESKIARHVQFEREQWEC